eukprot:UC4_evm5s1447
MTRTIKWIVKTFQNHDVTRVFLLGDVFDSRSWTPPNVQSEAIRMFSLFLHNFPHIHVIPGNHLDFLDLCKLDQGGLHFHRNPEMKTLDGFSVLFLPWEEDARKVGLTLSNSNTRDCIVMAHMGVSGDVMSKTQNTESSISFQNFEGVRRAFAGHFHRHQQLGQVTYVGSPLQFNYGEIGDYDRGVCIFDPCSDTFELIRNPYGNRFIAVEIGDIYEGSTTPLKNVVDKHVMLVDQGEAPDIHPQEYIELRKKLFSLGALNVRQKSEKKEISWNNYTDGNLHELGVKQSAAIYIDSMDDFSTSDKEALKDITSDIISCVDGETNADDLQDELSVDIFHGELAKITLENFLGVKGLKSLHISDMEDGIWYIVGPNGSGKSTILEALTWCHFGMFIRSDMMADFAINDDVNISFCRVRVDYKNGFSFERTRKCVGLKGGKTEFSVFKDGEAITSLRKGTLNETQRAVNRLLGTDYSTFVRTVTLSSENIERLNAASDSGRRQVIESMTGISKINEYAENVRIRMKDIKSQLEICRIDEKYTREKKVLACKQKVLAEAKVQNLSHKKAEIEASIESILIDEIMISEEKEEEIQAEASELYRTLSIKYENCMRSIKENSSLIEKAKLKISKLENKSKALKLTVQENKRKLAKLSRNNQLRDFSEQLATAEDKAIKAENATIWRRLLEEAHEDISTTRKLELENSQKHVESLNIFRDKLEYEVRAYIETSNEMWNKSENILRDIVSKINDSSSRHQLEKSINRLVDIYQKTVQGFRYILYDCKSKHQLMGDEKINDKAILTVLPKEIEERAHLKAKKIGRESLTLIKCAEKFSISDCNEALKTLSHVRTMQSEALQYAGEWQRAKIENEKSEEQKAIYAREIKITKDKIKRLVGEKYNVQQSVNHIERILIIAKKKLEDISSSRKVSRSLRNKHIKLKESQAQISVMTEMYENVIEKEAELEVKAQVDLSKIESRRLELEKKNILLKEISGLFGSGKKWKDRNGNNRQALREVMLKKSVGELNKLMENASQFFPEDVASQHNFGYVRLDPKTLSLPKSFAKLSSGQRRRTAIAIYYSLFELARANSRYQANYIMLDEAFDGLDEHGQQDVIRMLSEAFALNKIFIISHHSKTNQKSLMVHMCPTKGTQFNSQ